VTEIGEELLPGRGYVSAESSGVVVSAEEHKMIQLQKGLQPLVAE
jgi:hypothetical protein